MGECTETVPEGEALTRALCWLSEQLRDGASVSLQALVEQAALRFDLAPPEEEFLLDWWTAAVGEPVTGW